MRIAVGTVLTILGAASAAAQSALKPNEMVKVELISNQFIRGKTIRPTPDSLFFSDDSRVIALPASQIRSVATFEKDWWRGARRGAKVGAITGVALIAAGAVVDATYCRKPGSECMAPASFIGMAAAFHTTWIGAGSGFLTAPGRWSKPRPYLAR